MMLRPLLVSACASLLLPAAVFAQSGTGAIVDTPVVPFINGPTDVAVGRTLILDASSSRVDGVIERTEWFVEGQRQVISQSVEAVYTPEEAGQITFRLVLTVRTPEGERVSAEARHTVMAYTRKITLLADASVTDDKLARHRETAAAAGMFLRVVRLPEETTPLDAEEAFVTLLSDQPTAIVGADATVIWAEGIGGLQALMRVAQVNEEVKTSVQQQTIVVVVDGSIDALSRTARGPYGVLQPRSILLTRREALNALLSTETIDQFLAEISQRDIDFVTIDANSAGIRPWNVLSLLVNALLVRGVPSQTVLLLLILPVIATILTFLKQVVGVTTFGLYTPSIIAVSFLALGWQRGVVFLVAILLVGYGVRTLMKRWRLLYIPKVAIILTVVSIALLFLLSLGSMVGFTFTRETIFIVLIMSTLTESFLNLKTEEGTLSAVLGITETVLAALLCVFLVQWAPFQSLLLAYPELLIFTVIANVILGRWTGLRLVEYFRFRDVFRHLQEE